jgi:hypothetical protein
LAAQQPFFAAQQDFLLVLFFAEQAFLPAQHPFFAAQQPFFPAQQPFFAEHAPTFAEQPVAAQLAIAGGAAIAAAATTEAEIRFFKVLLRDVDFMCDSVN